MAVAELKQARTSSRKLDARRAAGLSLEYFHELFPDANIQNVLLEEVEFLDKENCWLITLGFDEPARRPTVPGLPSNLFGTSSSVRKFKIFKVNARTGQVISMKIRKLE